MWTHILYRMKLLLFYFIARNTVHTCIILALHQNATRTKYTHTHTHGNFCPQKFYWETKRMVLYCYFFKPFLFFSLLLCALYTYCVLTVRVGMMYNFAPRGNSEISPLWNWSRGVRVRARKQRHKTSASRWKIFVQKLKYRPPYGRLRSYYLFIPYK